MRSGLLARSRAVWCCACAVLAVGVGGCAAAGSSTVTVTGKTLTIYGSVPAQTDAPGLAADVLDAEQLALQQNGTQVGSFTIRFIRLDGKISDNARTAIQDSSAIAYLGELIPPSSYASLGITNALDVLQVSPTDTALELTQPTPAVPGAPTMYYESLGTYGRTFARVVPSTALEAKAQVREMQALHVKRLYVADDGGPYGAAVALAVKQESASAMSVIQGPADVAKFTASGADALFFGSNSGAEAASLFGRVATADPAADLFGPSALENNAFTGALGAAKLHLYISAPGFLPKDLTAAGRKFESDFAAAYHRAPALQAIFGYEAMAAVLAVLHESGASANNRSTVVRDFFAIKNRDSVLGPYSIDANGDTSLAPFVFSRYSAGKLIPYKFVQVLG